MKTIANRCSWIEDHILNFGKCLQVTLNKRTPQKFEKWFSEHLIPNNSATIIDNAPYCSYKLDITPTTASEKYKMQYWRNKYRIYQYEACMKKIIIVGNRTIEEQLFSTDAVNTIEETMNTSSML